MGLAQDVQDLLRLLDEEVTQLEQWANESISGSWSTHQVEPMRKRAAFLLDKVHKIRVRLRQ